MIKHLLTAAGLALSLFAAAQLSHGGQPSNWANKTAATGIEFERMGAIDREHLALEDAITDQYKDIPYRFGVEFETNFTLDNSGSLTHNTETGMSTWLLGLECPGALSMSIRFDEFLVPKDGEVFIWSADRKEFLGSFNYKNVKPNGVLACGLIHGDKIVVEYNYPTHLQDRGALKVGEVVHTYRPFASSPFVQDAVEALRGPFGSSGACNVNVNCPEAADWQIEKRSVAIIVQGGSGICTGALVNNTANDGTPYFLTANHCTAGSNVGNWVFYFNHEAAGCTGNTGPTSDLISGAELVANNAGSDVALLLLNDTPPASYNVQYAGWDATDDENAVSSAVCIHHPGGNVKKFSQEDDAPYHDVSGGAQVWWIDNWEIAITEPGSSGSPLFNQDHRIIGQLYGGASACNGSVGNGQYDFYGRFGVSWDNGNTAASRLIDWLDPLQTGTLVLDGYPEGFELPNLDAQSGGITGIAENNCSDQVSPVFTLVNHGTTTLVSCTINYQLNGGTTNSIPWTGSLNTNQTTSINLPQLTAANGANTLTVTITNVNGNANDDVSTNNSSTFGFNAVSGAASGFTVNITLDDYPEETSWDIQDNSGNIIASGSGYTGGTISTDVCVAIGCYEFTINDEYGDGICCDWGNGSYEVINSNGAIVAQGGTFTDSETTTICTTTVGITESNYSAVVLYPNPANDQVRIQANENIVELRVFDAFGRMITTIANAGTTSTLSTQHMADGVYHITVNTTNGGTHQTLVVRH
jgi:V8-like Glu-specific endopeptidase